MNRLDRYVNRKTNIELLRIIAIFLIVFSHWASHTHYSFSANQFTINQYLVEISQLGEIGVTVFVIISGFFSITHKQTVHGLLSLLFRIWTYNLLIELLSILINQKVAIKELVKTIIPFFEIHWFAYTFCLLYILMPFINSFIHNISKSGFKAILLLFLFGWSLVYSFTGATLGFSYLGWFVFLYCLGAYFKLYVNPNLDNRPFVICLICNLAILWLSTLLINVVGLHYHFYPLHGTYFYSMHSPFILMASISLFFIFNNIKVKHNKLINIMAASSFGIYLISDHPFLRELIWNNIFPGGVLSSSPYLLLWGIGCSLSVLVVSGAIDLIYLGIANTKPYNAFLNYSESLVKTMMSTVSSFFNKIEERFTGE